MPTTDTELVPVQGLNAPANSRFRRSGLLRDGEIEWFETYTFLPVPYTDQDVYHEVQTGEAGRLDLLAFTYYGTVTLWWLIAEANDLSFPLAEVVAGMTLRIPPIDMAFDRGLRV